MDEAMIKSFDRSKLIHVEPNVDQLSLEQWVNTEPNPYTSLFELARRTKGDIQQCKHLLTKLDVNGNNGAWTVLTWCAKNELDDLVIWLLEHGADANLKSPGFSEPPLWFARSFAVVKALVEHGADIHHITKHNSEGLLANRSDLDAIRFLIKRGINVNHQNGMGATALLFAVILGNFDVVKVLVEEGKADTSLADKEGLTPLAYAEEHGKKDIADYLRGK